MAFPRFPHQHPVLQTPAIWHRKDRREAFAVVLFRRRFDLAKEMRDVTLWVSASQRFELYLDGTLIARGPSRSDAQRWGCVPVTVPMLAAGPHVLAARVTHFGDHGGIGQLGGPGFFLLHAEAPAPELADLLDTGQDWACCEDRSRRPIDKHVWGKHSPYYVVGCGERINGAQAPWGWELPAFDAGAWSPAVVISKAADCPWGNVPIGHLLRPEPLPQMEETRQRFARIADAPDALRPDAERWVRGEGALTVPPHARVRLVLDQGTLTNAYPRLMLSGGAGARMRLVSAEAPYAGSFRAKSNRDDVTGKVFLGHRDELLPDGGTHRTYGTLWFRSFRYLEMTIRTADEPLVLEDIHSIYTAFPLAEQAAFEPDAAHRQALDRMWEVSWRTIRLCAHETFFDCPHYEQAQFPGDTRVQAVYHYLVANDDRLARKAIDDFHASRIAEGITQCRYPSRRLQLLPTFALYWMGMLHDFRVYRGDTDFLRPYLPAARDVLAWFGRLRRPDGLLGRVPYAPFIDWTPAFACGNAPQDADGGSALLSLLYAEACQWMAGLEEACGFPELAPRWRETAQTLVDASLQQCWDAARGLLADTASHASFSQHTQVQAVLAGAWPMSDAREILQRAQRDAEVAPPGTHYFRYYVAHVLRACGLGEHFFDLLPCWQRSLDGTGLTTWPETDRDARSDCHAWSVTPSIEFLQTVLGVQPDPAALGFDRVRFSPTLGPLTEARGTIPTPHGPVQVALRRRDDGTVEVALDTPVPALVTAEERWVQPGRHAFVLGDAAVASGSRTC